MQHDVESVIEHSQDYPFEVNMQEAIETWHKNKQYYIDLFDGEPIVRITKEPLSFCLTQQEKDSKFNKMLDDIEDEGFLFSYNKEEDYTLNDFLYENRDGFFENRVMVDHPSLKIRKGMKLSKCFKYFLPNFTVIRTIQDLASRYIQEDRITGHLYLSVHPLDFLTISENNNHWRSCHALDGEFRTGNLNYMLDDSTIVAYLAAETDVQLKAMPQGMLWNNKKWRMLIHTNHFESIIYYNRQYPYDSDTLVNCFYRYLDRLMPGCFKVPETLGFKKITMGTKNVESDYNYIFMDDMQCVYDMRDIVDDSGSMGYTDLVYSSYYVPVVSALRRDKSQYVKIAYQSEYKADWDAAFHNEFDITIGKECKCVKCGRGDIERASSFLCEDCIAEEDLDEDNYLKCDCCGCRIYPEDVSYMIADERLCQTCYDAVDKNEKKEI